MTDFGNLVGGLGLLLLALSMMTEGLRLAAGEKLTHILKKSTTPEWRGLLTGLTLTAVVQSSSAVTLATIGFVNAGLMTLGQAITVIFGTNVGTTMTGWLVSTLGFEVEIAVIALPMIGVGMLAKLIYNEHHYGGFGFALAGFGLFFLALSFMKAGFEGLSPVMNIQIVNDFGVMGILLGLLIGFAVTAAAQSSSAAIALILTATQSDVLMLPTAAAMFVGANIGTCSTAAFAAIGATSNARRVALAHIIFNLITGGIAILLLMAALPFATPLAEYGNSAALLALFHTGFNIMGVALIWSIRGRLTAFLLRQFHTMEEDIRQPKYLDRTLNETPALAIQALLQEVARIDSYLVTLVELALDETETVYSKLQPTQSAIRGLVEEVYGFAGMVQQKDMAPEIANQLATVLRVGQYFLEATYLTLRTKGVRSAILRLDDVAARRKTSRFINSIAPLIARTGQPAAPMVSVIQTESIQKLSHSYHELRASLLADVVNHKVPPNAVNDVLEILSTLNRLVSRVNKATQLLNSLATECMGKVQSAEHMFNKTNLDDPEDQPTKITQ